MTAFQRRVLMTLRNAGGKLYAYELGPLLWPGRRFNSAPGGGPHGSAVAATFQCAKIAHATGWVESVWCDGPSCWSITPKGRAALRGAP